MLPQRARKAIVDSPKKVASLIDLANLPSTLREFLGQSQISRLGCFIKVWSYIKTHNLQVLCSPSISSSPLLALDSILYLFCHISVPNHPGLG